MLYALKLCLGLVVIHCSNMILAVVPLGSPSPFLGQSIPTGVPGSFQEAPNSPFPAGGGPGWIAYSPIVAGNIFAAIPDYTNQSVVVYKLDTLTGSLTQIASSPFATGNGPATVAYSPIVEGNLFVGIPNAHANTISMYVVDQTTGALSPVGPDIPNGASLPYAVVFSPVVQGNLFAAVPNNGSNSVCMYLVDQATGNITPVAGSPFAGGVNPYGLAFSPVIEGNLFVAVANNYYLANNGTVSVYKVNQATGELVQVQGSPFTTGLNAISVAFSPVIAGKLFAAVTNSTDNTVSIFSVNPTTGVFVEIEDSPFSTGNFPSTVVYSPFVLGELFLAIANYNDNTISVYTVDLDSGKLKPLFGSPFAAGLGTDGVAYSPFFEGRLFSGAANLNDNTGSAYQVVTPSQASPIVLAIFAKYC